MLTLFILFDIKIITCFVQNKPKSARCTVSEMLTDQILKRVMRGKFSIFADQFSQTKEVHKWL